MMGTLRHTECKLSNHPHVAQFRNLQVQNVLACTEHSTALLRRRKSLNATREHKYLCTDSLRNSVTVIQMSFVDI